MKQRGGAFGRVGYSRNNATSLEGLREAGRSVGRSGSPTFLWLKVLTVVVVCAKFVEGEMENRLPPKKSDAILLLCVW